MSVTATLKPRGTVDFHSGSTYDILKGIRVSVLSLPVDQCLNPGSRRATQSYRIPGTGESLLKPAVSINHLLKRMVRLEKRIQLLQAKRAVSQKSQGDPGLADFGVAFGNVQDVQCGMQALGFGFRLVGDRELGALGGRGRHCGRCLEEGDEEEMNFRCRGVKD